MKRPLLVGAISYISGILWGLYFINMSIVLLCVCIFLIYIKKYIAHLYKTFIVIIIFLLFGVFNTLYKENKFKKIYNNFENKNIQIIATVISNKEKNSYNDMYKIKIDKIIDKNKETYVGNFRIILYVKSAKYSLEYGDKINLKADFIVADSKRNYKGFDYRTYLKSQNIYGIMKTNYRDIDVLQKSNINFILRISNKIKIKLINNITQIFPEEVTGILLGMLIGDTSLICDDIKDNFKTSSLTHLIAVSGSNMAYIMVAIIYVFNKIKIKRNISNIFAILVIIFFMLMTGLSASVVRAGIMGIILILSKLFYRKSDVFTSIGLSIILILLNNPFSIFDIGLQLSFLGTIRYSVNK